MDNCRQFQVDLHMHKCPIYEKGDIVGLGTVELKEEQGVRPRLALINLTFVWSSSKSQYYVRILLLNPP